MCIRDRHIYVVTLSGNLSGSYNSAMVGRQMYLEEDESKQIYVMDSCSASCGETQLALLAASLEEQGLPFEEVVSRLEAFRSEMNTYFVLDNLETLRKNGRLSGIKALVASTLSIKPVTVSYTHLTLPTKRIVKISGGDVSLKKKQTINNG